MVGKADFYSKMKCFSKWPNKMEYERYLLCQKQTWNQDLRYACADFPSLSITGTVFILTSIVVVLNCFLKTMKMVSQTIGNRNKFPSHDFVILKKMHQKTIFMECL